MKDYIFPVRPLRTPASLLVLLLSGACVLHPDVSVTPMNLLPVDVERSSNIIELYNRGQFGRGSLLASLIESRPRQSLRDLTALGECELAAGRFDAARHHLRAALDMNPAHSIAARIAWKLSETEYLVKNFSASEEWARMALDNGLRIRPWHIQLLSALRDIDVNHTVTMAPSRIPMEFGKPDIPRVSIRVEGQQMEAVIDSGAVMSIISETMAKKIGIQSLGDFQGEFVGLLGEPIPVTFGLAHQFKIGSVELSNVPVAIMPDRNLSFVVFNREPFKMNFLIGASLLREFRLELDFRRGEVTFTPLTAAARVPAADQNLFFSDFRPMVHATLNRLGWYLFVVDTGSEITFLNQKAVESTSMRNAARGGHSATLQGLGGSEKRGEKIENIQLGVASWAGTFRDIPLYGTEQSSAMGIIGQNFLEKFKVILDFGTMRMDLIRQ